MSTSVLANVTCVSVAGRGVLIEGPPGSGKSTLAMALIDRGAVLIGDDGVIVERRGAEQWALPAPAIAGKLEVRGVGIASLPTSSAPLALAVLLGQRGERLPTPTARELGGVVLPQLVFDGGETHLALRVEYALRMHGLSLPHRAP